MKVKAPAGPGGFVCSACGHVAPRWFGRCPGCDSWSSARSPDLATSTVLTLGRARIVDRRSCGVPEVDRVLGGGFVAGSVNLLCGEPGIGKSTLVLQLLHGVVSNGGRAMLVTGEESPDQVAIRAARVDVELSALPVTTCTVTDELPALCEKERPDVVVVDSIQTLRDGSVDQAPGSVAQVRAAAAALTRLAKDTGVIVVMVGHVTKDGSVAGPKTLEHAVDVVLSLEGERSGTVRVLRGVKNRFGSCEETGVFFMSGRGLEAVPDPSAMLLADRGPDVPGSVVSPALEGSRPVLVEIQALVDRSPLAQPRRVAIGLDHRRLSLVLAVLATRAATSLASYDLFVASAGGFEVREPAADLALAVALSSAVRGDPVARDIAVVGELGLAGEVRRVPGIERRLQEARRLGFNRALAPRGTADVDGLEVVIVEHVSDALARV